jgi:hypothetical protein
MKIFKQRLAIMPSQYLKVPTSHALLTIQLQNGQPTIWYLCDPYSIEEDIAIYCIATGQDTPQIKARYLGTIQLDGLVWHYFLGV